MLTSAGIQAELSPDIRKEIWSKFVGFNAISGVASVARIPGKAVMDDPDTRALYVDSMREVMELAQRQGISLDPNLSDTLVSIMDGWPPQAKPSMLLDLEHGHRLEVESIQGTVVRLGEKLQVPTPVNRFIYTALKPNAAGAS